MITRKICELWDKQRSVFWQTYEEIQRIVNSINKIIELRNSLKYGLVDLGDIVSAELLATVKNMASRITDAVLEQASTIASSAISAILQPLLRILLFAPNAIFTLVALPHRRGMESAIRERTELNNVEAKLNIVLYILNKWLDDTNSPNYRQQIETAIPVITECIKLTSDMIIELDSSNPDETGSGSAFFNQNLYNDLQKKLKQAIEVTETQSVTEIRLNIKAQQQQAADEIYADRLVEIKSNYKEQKAASQRLYTKEMIAANNKNSLAAVGVEQLRVKREYDYRMQAIESDYKLNRAAARTGAETEALFSSNLYTSAAASTAIQFQNDLENLNNALSEMFQALGNAYRFYQTSQQCCQTVVNASSKVRELVSWLISILQQTGDGAADTISEVFDASLSNMEVARDVLIAQIEKNQKLARSGDLTALISSNTLLKSADTILQGTVTEELIRLINSDEALGANSVLFQEFIERLNAIQDFNNPNVGWLSNQAGTSPYPNLLIKVSALIAQVPGKLTARDASLKEDIDRVRDTIDTLKKHSTVVTSTLKTFIPFSTPEGNELRELLAKMNLLNTFAIGFNIADVIESLIRGSITNGWELPTAENCKAMYPDLQISENAVKAQEADIVTSVVSADLAVINKNFSPDEDFLPQRASINFKNPLENFEDVIADERYR